MEVGIDRNRLYSMLLNKSGICVLYTILGMFIGIYFIPKALALVSLILILIAFLALLVMRKSNVTMIFGYAISILMGVGISPYINYYVGELGVTLVFTIFIATCLITLGLSFIGYTTQKDLSAFGSILFIGLICLIIGGVLNLFLHFKLLELILTLAGIVIFSTYIVVDMKMAMETISCKEDIPMHVIDLYLDFINLFLNILELIGSILKDSN